MTRGQLRLGLVLLFACTAMAVVADSGGPPQARTGAPATGPRAAEQTCTSCHSDQPLQATGLEILDVPAYFRAGSVYTLRVRLTSSATAGAAQRKWGFEMTAIDAATGDSAGTLFNVPGENTQVLQGSGSRSTRHYIEHLDAGTRTGASSPVQWLVRWHAPTNGASGVRFYATGLAADGDGAEGGDWVYAASAASSDTVTDARLTSWGAIKSKYR